jgi:flagellar motor switch protein FliN/FliY
MGVEERQALARWIVDQCADQLAAALAAMSEEQPETTVEAGVAADPGWLWLEQTLAGTPDARIAAGAGTDTWRAIGSRVLSAAGIDEADDNDTRNTYFEIVTQALGGLTRKFTERIGMEVTSEASRQFEADPQAAHCFHMVLRFKDGSSVPVALAFSDGVLHMLASDSAAESAGDAPGPAAPHQQQPQHQEDYESITGSPTLDLLMDVELPVSVLFGRAQVQLQDVLKLSTGSIVELDRTIAEPVEIIVNNCVIARGEVVVVEGNYGVRIEEIVSRKERLRSTRSVAFAAAPRETSTLVN